MTINLSVYQKLLQSFPLVPPEAGAILGEIDGTIVLFSYDPGLPCYDSAVYSPSVERLNSTICGWAEQGITFCGIAHSHPLGQEELSAADIAYIHSIMGHMPEEIDRLYFPLVFPGEKIISFVATRKNAKVTISPANILLKQ